MGVFSLSIHLLLAQVSLEGPIPLSLVITYHGNESIEVLSDDFIDIEFEPPPGWESKGIARIRHLEGILPTVALCEGESLSRQVYLHDYFSSISPGRTGLPVVVKIWPKTGDSDEPFVLRGACALNILEPDPEHFEQRIAQIHQGILTETSAEKRLELYQSVASLSHAHLIPIFLESLLDPHMLVFHATARRRLVDLAEIYGTRPLLIKHLADHGSRYDAEFFRLWQEKRVRLSAEEIAQLCESASLWTRLFCLEHDREQYNRKGLIRSLESELEELMERVRKLTNG